MGHGNRALAKICATNFKTPASILLDRGRRNDNTIRGNGKRKGIGELALAAG
ncbi:MAG: hypothetical protein U0X93_07945 [Anaerolineales bacterium]